MIKRIKVELAKIKKMSGKQRLSYLWEYYKGIVIVPIVAIFVIYILAVNFAGDGKREVLYGVVIGNNLGLENEETIQIKVADYLGIDQEKEKVIIDSSMQLTIGETLPDEVSQMNMAKMTAYISGHELDFIIGTKEVINHYNSLNALKNLEQYILNDSDTLIAKDIISGNEEKYLYFAPDKENIEVPCAIILETGEFVKEEKMYLSVIETTDNDENVKKFVEYVLENEE